MRFKTISILSLILFSIPLLAQQSKIPVAILDLEVSGLDSAIAPVLSSRLHAEILKTGEFDVMERSRMEEVLTEQGFQQTGVCNTDECVVEAGRLLGVTRMVAGSIGKIGTLYTITVRMIDVETGRILLSATEDTQGPIENVLTLSLNKVAKKLSARAATSSERLTGHGSLRITSNPDSARIFVDDKAVAGLTPFGIDSLSAGVHVVRVQKNLLAASQAIFIAPNERSELNLQLSMSKGAVKIITDPPNAKIFIDQNKRGVSPKQIFDLPVGSYYLKLSKDGYVDHARIISIKENETTVVSARMTSMAYLTATSNPPNCQISIDDSITGTTPMRSFKIKPGYHKIQIRKTGFVPFIETGSFPAGETTEYDVTLKRVATLVVASEPVDADVFIDGFHKGVTPLTISDLEPGIAEVKISKQYFEDYRSQIELQEGTIKNVEITMDRKKGTLKIQSIPSVAEVEIDGVVVGTTPFESNEVDFGKHLVVLKKPGFRTDRREILIEDQLPQTVRVNFEIAKGLLYIHTTPRDANVYLDSKRIREITATGIALLPGQYKVRAVRPGYENFSDEADIKPDDAVSMNIKMTPKSRRNAVIRSLILPGWGQRYAEKQDRQILFPILEGCSLVGILFSDLIYDEQISDYRSARSKYLTAISESDIARHRQDALDAFDSADKAKDARQFFTYAAVGIWIVNVLDSAIFPPIRPVFSSESYSVNISVNF